MDVTGTLLSFRGSLKTHYLGSAFKCGVQLDADAPIENAFKTAYKEMCTSKFDQNSVTSDPSLLVPDIHVPWLIIRISLLWL
jgi:hypothetical protein